MKRFFNTTLVLAALPFALAAPASAAVVMIDDFSTPVTTAATQAPDTWYTDRYAPAGFQASGGQLVQTISSADSATNRPAAYSGAFYNTQGRKLDMPAGTTNATIDLLVPDSWATTGQRMAGFWGTAFNAADVLSFYPILEYTSDTANPRFRVWDNGVWIDVGMPVDVGNDDSYALGYALNGGMFDYLIDGVVVASVNALGSTYIGNVILQGHNNYARDAQGSYDIHWDNLRTGNDVPEPGTLALAAIALVPLVWGRRRQTKQHVATA